MPDGENRIIENRFYELLDLTRRLTDAEVQELRELLSRSTFAMVREHVLNKAQVRVQLDLIEAIREFDKASGRMVATTNTLTSYILYLTLAAIIVGLANVLASAWTPLTGWVKHGFHFRY